MSQRKEPETLWEVIEQLGQLFARVETLEESLESVKDALGSGEAWPTVRQELSRLDEEIRELRSLP